MAYIRSAQSGNFSAASTWVGGVVPTTGDIACTLAHRIVLDVDTGASLSVSRTDWVAGGGTDSATITGGFTLPVDATRVVGGDIRYDNGTNSSRSTSTTSPVYMTSGTLTVRSLVWVAGTNAIVSGSPTLYVVNIATVSGKTSKFTYTGTATLLINTGVSLGTTNVYSVYVTGSGFADLTFGEVVQVQAVAGASASSSMIALINNGAGGYNLTLNGNVPTGAALSNSGVIHISAPTTGLDNQKIIVNSDTLGLCPVVATAINAAIYVATTNGVSSLSITPPKLSLHGYGQIVISASGYPCCAFGFTANSLETFYNGGISIINAGSVTTGNIYINSLSASYTSAAIIFSGTGDVTLGDIILRAITSVLVSARSVKAVTLLGTGNITVGNISSEAGQLSEIGLLRIENTTPNTKSVTVGNIDASNVYVRATSNNNHPLAVQAHLVYIARRTTGTITVGNVIGANNGLNVASDVFALTLSGFAADNGTVTINGNVMAGNRMSAVLISSSATPVVINGYIQGVSSILGTLINIPVGVVTYGVVTCNAIKQAVKNCVAVFGQFYFNSYTDGVITLVDSSDNVYGLFTVAQTNQVIPAAGDVRSGVLVGSTTGTLYVPPASAVLLGVPVDNTTGTYSLTAQINALSDTTNAIKAQTDKLGFNASNNVLASATVDMSGLTPRFDTIDASLTTANTGITAANNAVAAVKAKTDQLSFGAGGVIAQTGSTDYTARFDTLETQVANIPTLTYTTSFAGINTKLDTLQATVSSGGVDLTPVTNAIAAVDGKVTNVKAKTDQLTFGAGGVIADVTVSVQAAIDYTEQFTEITSKLDNVQLVTDTFQFNANGVIASATVDMSGMVSRFDNLDIAIDALPVQSHTDAQYNTLFNQLNVIGNATGAIDLTPIMTSLSQIYTSVENVPRLTYSAAFVNVNNKLDALATATADVDFTPVLNAIAAIPAPNLTTITTKLDNMQADVTTIKDAAVRIEVLSSGIRDKLSTATGVDLSGVEHQLSLLNSKFDGVDAPVQVVPTGNAGTTVLYAHCTHSDGTPAAGQSATLHIMQVVGEGVLLPDHTLTSTSGADGLISFVLPRDAGISAMFEYRGRKERVVLVGDATQALPSIVAKL